MMNAYIDISFTIFCMSIYAGNLGIKFYSVMRTTVISQYNRKSSPARFKYVHLLSPINVYLVCTLWTAIHINILSMQVINFTMPNTHSHYIHRVGRTARAGKSGRAVTLVGEKERKVLKEIVKKAKNAVKSRVIPQGEHLR